MLRNVTDLLKKEESYVARELDGNIQVFIGLLQGEKDSTTWANLIKSLWSELSELLLSENPKISTPILPSQLLVISTPRQSTPKAVLSKIKKFTPLVDKSIRLPCTGLPNPCKSKLFLHKRSYLKHLRVFHNNQGINHQFKDPPGTCELINKVTNRPCHAKLSTRSMIYHLEHVHNVHRPDKDHVLLGFITTSFRRAVFVPKGTESEYLDSPSQDEAVSEPIPTNEVLEPEKEKSIKNENAIISPMCAASNDEDSNENTPVFSKIKSAKRKLPVSPNLSELSNLTDMSTLSVFDMDTEQQHNLLEDLGNFDFDEIFNIPTEPLEEDILNVPTQPLRTASSDEEGYGKDNKHSPSSNDQLKDQSSSTSEESGFIGENPKISPQNSVAESENKDSIHMEKQKHSNLTSLNASTSAQDENSIENPISSQEFSDHEADDEEAFTEFRRLNKRIRYSARNTLHLPLNEKEHNRDFIQDFIVFMTSNSISTESTSTSAKAVNHLFMFEEISFLAFESKANPNFNLESLRCFDKPEKLVHLTYPGDWIVSTAGNDGNRGLDHLKSHKKLRDFLEYSVDKFNSSQEFSVTKKAVRDTLDGIEKQIKRNRLWRKYTVLSNQKKQKKDKANMILTPSRNLNIENIVKTWNSSLEKEETYRDHNFIFQSAVEKNSISAKNFTKYSQFSRMALFLRLKIA